MESVSIREANVTDIQEILAIRKVYAGRDYLPEMIHDILSRHKGYVAVCDGKIIGFIVAAIIDEGMTLLPRAGRVREDFEGKGVYAMMDQHIMSIHGHSVDFKAVCFHDKNVSLVKKFEAGLLNTTFYREIFAFKALRVDLKKLRPALTTSEVEELNKEDLENVLTSETLCQILFPKKVFATFWMPLRVLKGNVDVILSETGAVFGSCVKERTDQSKALLSIEHSYNCSLGRIYNLELYGNNTDNLIQHFALHVERALTFTTEEVIIFEVFPAPGLIPEVTTALTKLGFKTYNWDVATKIYCIEYNVKTK